MVLSQLEQSQAQREMLHRKAMASLDGATTWSKREAAAAVHDAPAEEFWEGVVDAKLAAAERRHQREKLGLEQQLSAMRDQLAAAEARALEAETRLTRLTLVQ